MDETNRNVTYSIYFSKLTHDLAPRYYGEHVGVPCLESIQPARSMTAVTMDNTSIGYFDY